MIYYLSLGSNINPKINIDRGLALLAKHITIIDISDHYLSKSVGFAGDDFINVVLSCCSLENKNNFNQYLKTIEQQCGRTYSMKNFNSRTLDIDIILQLDDAHKLYMANDIIQYDFVRKPFLQIFKEDHDILTTSST